MRLSLYRLPMDFNNKIKLFLFFLVALFLFTPVMAIAHHASCRDVHTEVYMEEPVELAILLSLGADQNCRDKLYQTPLITATNGASLETVKLLLKRGVNVNSSDEIGEIALTNARQKLAFFDMKGGKNYRQLHQEMIDLLVQAGAIE